MNKYTNLEKEKQRKPLVLLILFLPFQIVYNLVKILGAIVYAPNYFLCFISKVNKKIIF